MLDQLSQIKRPPTGSSPRVPWRAHPEDQGPSAPSPTRPRLPHRSFAITCLALVALLFIGTLHSAADTALVPASQATKARLDQELAHARRDLGIPDALLQSITAREWRIAAGQGDAFYSYADAASAYSRLYVDLLAVEQSAPTLLRQQAQDALQAFSDLLVRQRAEGLPDASAFQARLSQGYTELAQAQVPGDYARITAFAQAQTQALATIGPAYQKLSALKSVVDALRSPGVAAPGATALAQAFYDQDAQLLRNAPSADGYTAVGRMIDAQIMQLAADQTLAQPYVTQALLRVFQDRIDLLRRYGDPGDADHFQQQRDADAMRLASAASLSDELELALTMTQQSDAMEQPLMVAKAAYDLDALRLLVNSANARTVRDPANNKDYPLAYEYADPNDGVGDVAGQFAGAKTLKQYAAADAAILTLTVNLRAMLDNLSDPTPYNQPHRADLDLLRYYNVTQGRVVIISLREQAARFYENGQVVNASLVTTGRPGEPSLPGYHLAIAKRSPLTFTSPDPPGSPNYYNPTIVNYAVAYDNNGFWLHDAYWRSWFGPNSNLPHHDPNAFNGGSHGCVNFPESFMPWAFHWIPLNAPVILY